MTDAIHDNEAESRYELMVDDRLAIAAYRREGDVLVFTHTAVPDDLQGRGIGSRLIAGALQDVRAKGLRIVPECPFVAAYVADHPDEQDLIAG